MSLEKLSPVSRWKRCDQHVAFVNVIAPKPQPVNSNKAFQCGQHVFQLHVAGAARCVLVSELSIDAAFVEVSSFAKLA